MNAGGFLGHCFERKMSESVSSYLILSHFIIFYIHSLLSRFASVCVCNFGILQDARSVEQTEWTWTNQLEVWLKQSLSVLERASKVFRINHNTEVWHLFSCDPLGQISIAENCSYLYVYVCVCGCCTWHAACQSCDQGSDAKHLLPSV